MADRKQFLRDVVVDPELTKVLEDSKAKAVTEDELRQQRISFAFGNAPFGSEGRITKDSVRIASENIKLLP
jgi:hypothetical protein